MGSGLAGGPLTGGPAAAPSLLPGATGTDLTLSGALTAGNGSAAAPSINFLSSLTTGFYRLAAGIVGFASAGVYSLEFQSAGVIAGGVSKLTLTTAAGVALAYGANTTYLLIDSVNLTIGGSGAGLVQRWAGTTGLISVRGTDSSGTPGAATIDKPSGKSAIALGAASVVITNALVTAASCVHITPQTRDATCVELIAVPGAGSFTVSGAAAATADLVFSWHVQNIL